MLKWSELAHGCPMWFYMAWIFVFQVLSWLPVILKWGPK